MGTSRVIISPGPIDAQSRELPAKSFKVRTIRLCHVPTKTDYPSRSRRDWSCYLATKEHSSDIRLSRSQSSRPTPLPYVLADCRDDSFFLLFTMIYSLRQQPPLTRCSCALILFSHHIWLPKQIPDFVPSPRLHHAFSARGTLAEAMIHLREQWAGTRP